MLERAGCQQCAMMERIVGDLVETADAMERPDLTALTQYTSLPIYLVFKGEQCIGSFHGMMPRAEFERRIARY